ncbi:[FeFe] hydrogenase H-cluster radical SAM maturase HydE [Desulfurobacterium atlanticum]|uniref:Iron-only hydrogenase maturation protein HydE n=1 Tax=Desulfurobacterium atlanticum TaxID=240169 RepID=A0A238ZV16_9BACT|nr:[FeFe] hydrogenase H-cluster radical SAM maturase HydE [Desulfurobacterium atlanticum]SNR87069.1 iron-only hydrogenase maturation protein HydE [Desulfurobacterium atlanticum]
MELSDERVLEELSLSGVSSSLISLADVVRKQSVGEFVYFRGLIEISNICNKNCFYCGLRKDNLNLKRYAMTEDEAVEIAVSMYRSGLTSLALQSGEVKSDRWVEKLVSIVRRIKEETKKIDIESGKEPEGAGITASFGELEKEHYEELFKAGAHRYLLRIESSNRELFYKLHPEDSNHSYENRIKCLEWLKEIGYQVGTGVLIGVPGQTEKDLLNDIRFFQSFDVDMVGMGPYIEHRNTPLYVWHRKEIESKGFYRRAYELTIKMIAITRIIMEDINMVASTALQSVPGCENSLEMGIIAGANVVMPTFTPPDVKSSYNIYNKRRNLSLKEMVERIEKAGYTPVLDRWGDPKHFLKREGKPSPV